MRLVLTGASGFLGREILQQLTNAQDIAIVAVSRNVHDPAALPDAAVHSTADGETKPTWVTPTMLLGDSFDFSENDVVLHCAFPRNAADGKALAAGLQFTRDLFAKAAVQNAGAVINVSSQSVYSQKRTTPAKESDPVCPETLYAVGKFATELLLDAACASIPHTNIRLASLIGPGFDQRVVNKLVKQALAGETLEITERGQQFGFLDVKDAARALVLLMRSNTSNWQPVYNLGAGNAFSLGEMAKTVAMVVGSFTDIEVNTSIQQPLDCLPETSAVDTSLLMSSIFWHGELSLEDTVTRIVCYEIETADRGCGERK